MSHVKILCPVCFIETQVSIKELEEYSAFTCKKYLKSFPVDMTEYNKLKSAQYNKTHYLVRSIDFKAKVDYETME
jgi:hypothetical protein